MTATGITTTATSTDASSPLGTGTDDATPSTDTLTLAALRAMGDRAVAWARAAGGTALREPGLVLADASSPCLFLNVAVATEPPDAGAAARIAAFFPPGRSFLLVSPLPTADLRPAGLVLMGHPPFMVRPAGRAGAPAVVSGDGRSGDRRHSRGPDVTVEEVTDPGLLQVWDRVLADGYPTPASPAPAGLLGGTSRFWLARVDGEPAGCALSHVGHGVVDVEAVATLPRFRRRGVGAAVTWAATTAAPADPAILIASDAGAGVYRELGYLPVTRWTLWFRP